MPTGPLEPYPGVKADEKFTLGPVEPDIDHCFVVNTDSASVPIDTRAGKLALLAQFYHPDSKIHLEVLSTDPAFQFYTGKYIEVPAVGSKPERKARAGFCVEPSRYVDAVNREEWKSQVLLKKGEKYGTRIVYKAWKD
jgi:aldose 1-epimerase